MESCVLQAVTPLLSFYFTYGEKAPFFSSTLALCLMLLLNAVGYEACIHDILKHPRSYSPQIYELNAQTSFLRHRDFSANAHAGMARKSPPFFDTRYRFHHELNNSNIKRRPKRSVEYKGNETNRAPTQGNGSLSAPASENYVNQTMMNLSYRSPASDHKTLFKPIRIKLFFDDNHILFGKSTTEYERLNNSLQLAVKKIEKLLSVIPVQGPLLFSRTPSLICGSFWSESSLSRAKQRRCAIARRSYQGEKCLDDFQIPDDHLRGYSIYKNNTNIPTYTLYEDGAGLAGTDTVFYIQAKDSLLCQSEDVIAYATYCQLDQYNRPIAGFANFCPNYLSDALYDGDLLYLTSVHEFFHALGFSKDLFDKFQDCRPKTWKRKNGNGTFFQWFCENKRKTIAFVENRKHIVSPTVRTETRRHLNCSSKAGCPLENLVVPPLRTSSHWESKFMQGSVMAPTMGLPHLTVIDRITLGAFQDMGWYQVNFDEAEELMWGKDAGCNFAIDNNCFSTQSKFFCQRNLIGTENGCHHLHLSKGRCETDSYLETCAVYKTHAGMECWVERNSTKMSELKGEIYSSQSRCFVSDLILRNARLRPLGPAKMEGRCYHHRCNDSETLEVKLKDSEWKACSTDSIVQFDDYYGHLICPPVDVLCGYPVNVNVSFVPDTQEKPLYCARIVVTFPELSSLHYQTSQQHTQSNSTRETRRTLDLFLVKFTDEIARVAGVLKTRLINAEFVNGTIVQFALLKSNGTSKAESGVEDDESSELVQQDPCAVVIKRLLTAVRRGDFNVPFYGELFNANNINFTLLNENIVGTDIWNQQPIEKTTHTGKLAAIGVGSVCVTMLIAIGIVIYWKNQVTSTVSPSPLSPTSGVVRYHPNNGSTVVAPSESGSVGQITSISR